MSAQPPVIAMPFGDWPTKRTGLGTAEIWIEDHPVVLRVGLLPGTDPVPVSVPVWVAGHHGHHTMISW